MLSSRQSALRPAAGPRAAAGRPDRRPAISRRRRCRAACVQISPAIARRWTRASSPVRPSESGRVEHVRVGQPGAEDHVGVRERRRRRPRAPAGAGPSRSPPGASSQDDVRGGLRPGAGGIDGVGPSLDDRRVEGVLHERRRVGRPEQPFRVRVVVGEQPRRLAVDGEPVVAHPPVRREHGPPVPAVRVQADRGLLRVVTPRPGVAVPERRQQVERRRLRAAVRGGDPDDDVLRSGLGVFDDDVEEPVLVEDPRVGQLVLGRVATAARVLGDAGPRTGTRPADSGRAP